MWFKLSEDESECRYLYVFEVCSSQYIDLVDTVTATSPARPRLGKMYLVVCSTAVT